MIVAEEDTSATIFLIFFHNHPVKSIDFLSLCEKTNLFSFLFLNGKEFCEMGFARKDVEATKKMEKKFVRYPEGADIPGSDSYHFGMRRTLTRLVLLKQ